MTIAEVMRLGMLELKNNNVEEPKLKSRLLMQFILDKSRQYVIVNDMEELDKVKEKEYSNAIKKLCSGFPIEHITHQKEFMKLNFFVNEDVLIPRQDTEILVEEVIDLTNKMRAKNILDLCTGSGAIAISLAKYLPSVEVIGTDISDSALKIARKNAIENEVNVEFRKSDIFEKLEGEKFDIIVSNPPYIKKDVIEKLDEQVRKEPYIALDGGEDGLDFYRKIIQEAYLYLKFGGFLCLEIGYDQKEEVMKLIEAEEKFSDIYCKKDLYDNDRIVIARLK